MKSTDFLAFFLKLQPLIGSSLAHQRVDDLRRRLALWARIRLGGRHPNEARRALLWELAAEIANEAWDPADLRRSAFLRQLALRGLDAVEDLDIRVGADWTDDQIRRWANNFERLLDAREVTKFLQTATTKVI